MPEAPASPVSGDISVLAERYIGALFELAEQGGILDTVLSDMTGLRDLWNKSAELRFIAMDPRIGSEDVVKAAKTVAATAKLNKLTSNFIAVLAQNHRLNLLPVLIERFLDDVSAKRGEFRADVRVARPIAQDQVHKLSSLLSAATGGKIRLSMIEDPSIVGGLTVKVGSQFIDASIKTKLDLLERSLKGALHSV